MISLNYFYHCFVLWVLFLPSKLTFGIDFQMQNKFLTFMIGKTSQEKSVSEQVLETEPKGGQGFPGDASGKEPACRCSGCKRYGFSPWVGKIPWRRKWHPTPVSLPGKPHGQRSLVGFSLWGHKESDTTERLNTCKHSS